MLLRKVWQFPMPSRMMVKTRNTTRNKLSHCICPIQVVTYRQSYKPLHIGPKGAQCALLLSTLKQLGPNCCRSWQWPCSKVLLLEENKTKTNKAKQNKRIMEVRNLLSHCLVLISLVTPLDKVKITALSGPSLETSPSMVAAPFYTILIFTEKFPFMNLHSRKPAGPEC